MWGWLLKFFKKGQNCEVNYFLRLNFFWKYVFIAFNFVHFSCEMQTDICEVKPCLNKARCENYNNVRRKCVCQPGFTGVDCETNIGKYYYFIWDITQSPASVLMMYVMFWNKLYTCNIVNNWLTYWKLWRNRIYELWSATPCSFV